MTVSLFPKIKREKNSKDFFLCPECQFSFNPNQAIIIEQKDNLSLIQIECQNCKTSILSLVMTNEFFMSNLEITIDLTKEDLSLLKNRRVIAADQVIKFSHFLENTKEE